MLFVIYSNYIRNIYENEKFIMEKIDTIDRRLLRILQKNGRISNSDLADAVALSPSACHRRLKRLSDEGVIKSFCAMIEPSAIAIRSTIFVEITLSKQSSEELDIFEKEVKKIDEVLECHLMAGSADYLLKIVASDNDDFERIHRNFLSKLPGIANMKSNFALRTVFKTTALPI